MRRFSVILALICVSSGCSDRERTPATAAVPPIASSDSPNSDADSPKPETVRPVTNVIAPPPTQQREVVTLTERAAKVLRAMAKRNKLNESIYLRVVAERDGETGVRYDLNITKKVDPKTDVFTESKGIRIVVNRSSLQFVRGGTVDFQRGVKQPGFQFHKPEAVDGDFQQANRTDILRHANRPLAINLKPVRSSRDRLGDAYGAKTSASSFNMSEPYSNIHAEDYVGPQTCAECHAKQYNLWRTHPHSKMNLDASLETVVGDFSGTTLEYADGSAVFEKKDGDFHVTMLRKGEFVRRYRVTRTVGSRIFQMYIGVQAEGPEAPDDSIYTDERKLPFAYWIKRQQWFPETYDEPVAAPEYDETGLLTHSYGIHTRNFRPIWQESCLWCHNTYPYEARLQKRLVGFPPSDVSLTRIRHPVPPGRTAHSLSLPPAELVTLGISCESCHFGGREHAIEKREIRFVPSSEDLEFPKATADLVANARNNPYVVNAICAQCHAVRHPKYPNVASSWNSAEALDMQGGACRSAIKCTDCHNPHQPGPPMGGGPDRKEHIEACLRCHEKYRAPAAAAAHTRHPSSSQVSCLDCHMPRIVHGLHDIIRTHQISSPTDPRMFSKGAPNACNICHLDHSVRWTLDALETGWGRKLEPLTSWKKWYGGTLDKPTGIAWLQHQAPMARQVAVDAYSRSPLGKAALPRILPILNDDNPATRMFALFAIERILGRQIDLKEYSPWSAPAERAKQVQALAQ